MEIRFVKADPSGNTTLFIPDPFPRNEMPGLAARLIDATGAEQVAFLERPTISGAAARMQMAGGEFCGNATRSFGGWLAMGGPEGPLAPVENPAQINIEVSGHDSLLTVTVSAAANRLACSADVTMPSPRKLVHDNSPELGQYSLVEFTGIVHLVLWQQAADKALLSPARACIKQHGLSDQSFGIMFTDMQHCAMTPLVYVGAVGSLIWESSCGSGSVAVACALAHMHSHDIERLELSQPGGSLIVHADSKCLSPSLGGVVRFSEIDTVEI